MRAMPLYEYVCGRCGEVFEVLFRTQREAAAEAGPACPTCSAVAAERLVSSFATGNRVDVGPGRAAYPYTWEQTRGGDPEALSYWRKRIQREEREELNDPELRMKRDQVARQRYGQAPAASGHEHGHSHGHSHGHAPHDHARAPSAEPGQQGGAAGEGLRPAPARGLEGGAPPPDRGAGAPQPGSHDAWKYVQFVRPKDDRKPQPAPGDGSKQGA